MKHNKRIGGSVTWKVIDKWRDGLDYENRKKFNAEIARERKFLRLRGKKCPY